MLLRLSGLFEGEGESGWHTGVVSPFLPLWRGGWWRPAQAGLFEGSSSPDYRCRRSPILAGWVVEDGGRACSPHVSVRCGAASPA
jgi:hypothetical protein